MVVYVRCFSGVEEFYLNEKPEFKTWLQVQCPPGTLKVGMKSCGWKIIEVKPRCRWLGFGPQDHRVRIVKTKQFGDDFRLWVTPELVTYLSITKRT